MSKSHRDWLDRSRANAEKNAADRRIAELEAWQKEARELLVETQQVYLDERLSDEWQNRRDALLEDE